VMRYGGPDGDGSHDTRARRRDFILFHEALHRQHVTQHVRPVAGTKLVIVASLYRQVIGALHAALTDRRSREPVAVPRAQLGPWDGYREL